jgi:8-oxo-dGTP pyrophosphatase MutT (NUDIX family)
MNKSPQMYKIYINEVKCLLVATKDYHHLEPKDGEKLLSAMYMGKVKQLLTYIDMCEKQHKIDTLIIHYSDFDILYKDFTSLFKIQIAAGGLIQNEKNEYLFIYRRGFWDLPKGKIEKNETKKEAGLREVIEETGITSVTLKFKITVTHHTFKNKVGNRIIKTSHWYMMEAPFQKLIPQIAEDIELAEWVNLDYFIENHSPVYRNILDVIDVYKEKSTNKNEK